MIGTVHVDDKCEPLTRVATSSIVAIAEGGLSTISFEVPTGSSLEHERYSGFRAVPAASSHIAALDVRDLPAQLGAFPIGR